MNDVKKENSKIEDLKEEVVNENKELKSVLEKKEVVDSKDDRIIQLELMLAQLKEHERDSVLRLKAEVENVRRRGDKEIEKAYKFGLERLICELLSVIDSLESALNVMDRSNEIFKSIIEGMELTLKLFINILKKFGVEIVDIVDIDFNPDIHQAISMIEVKEKKSNQVLKIVQKGYLLNGRLIRPAMVIVSKDVS